MSFKQCFFEVPFKGDLSKVDDFYRPLGVVSNNGVVKFESFEIFYGDGMVSETFQLVIEVHKDPVDIEKLVRDNHGVIIEDGFDMSGPFMIVHDPAGLRLRINSIN